ncbi:MAG TPA: hypothetical protein VN845_01860 [Solirubrobacteraceae bacterium]|nr:hypothetical protein [Solirubrobacteraceae bacterium]
MTCEWLLWLSGAELCDPLPLLLVSTTASATTATSTAAADASRNASERLCGRRLDI